MGNQSSSFSAGVPVSDTYLPQQESSNQNNITTKPSVDLIPYGTPPPSNTTVINEAKKFALSRLSIYNPSDIHQCQENLKTANINSKSQSPSFSEEQNHKVEKICNVLSSYDPNASSFQEVKLRMILLNYPEVWISSTLNSDKTISYWIEYPLQPFHIQAGILKSMNILINAENLNKIQKKYETFYKFLVVKFGNSDIYKCEQVDPLYLRMFIKSLIGCGYQTFKKKVEENSESTET
jgi:hypothetical protein